MLCLSRTGARFQYERRGQTFEGVRGLLQIGPIEWPTIERGDGYKHLPPGKYACEFAFVTDRGGRRWKAIRILGEYSGGRIYIHAANSPHDLEGCIAPGSRESVLGVSESRLALFQIFEALGGWEEGKRFELEVV